MATLLSEAAVTAIADLGVDGVRFEDDVSPALAAVGLPAVRARPDVRANDMMVSLFVPIARDDITASIRGLDLADPDVVERVLRFTARIAEVYAAGPAADRAKLIRLRNALADDGYHLEVGHTPCIEDNETVRGDMARVSINKREIARQMKAIQQEYDKHPIRVPVVANDPTDLPGGGTTINYNGPVFHGNADGAQLAWGNQTVSQTQNRTEQVAPGFEAITQAVVKTLEGLSAAGLSQEDEQDAKAVADEILAEVTQPEPDKGKVRRALAALKGFLAPVAQGLSAGAGEGAQEWARTAVEQLGTAF